MPHVHSRPSAGFDFGSSGSELDPEPLRAQISMDGDTQEVSSSQEIRDATKTPYIIIPKDIKEQIKEFSEDRFVALIAGYVGTRGYVCSRFEVGDSVVTLYTSRGPTWWPHESVLAVFPLERLIEIISKDRISLKKIQFAMGVNQRQPSLELPTEGMPPGMYL